MGLDEFHSWSPLLSRGAALSICEGDRGVGKSYPMIVRAIKRYRRRRSGMLWLRRTDVESISLLRSFMNGKWCKIIRQCGESPEDFRRYGEYIQIRDGGTWHNFIHYSSVSQHAALRDADDPNIDTIFFDEAFATPERIRMYRGNEVRDALDILKSMKRNPEQNVRMIVCGNRESVSSLWFDYFGVKRPNINEGICIIKTPGGGKIAYERVLNHRGTDEFDTLVSGTEYGGFLAGLSKGVDVSMLMPLSGGAIPYAAFDFGAYTSLWRCGCYMIFSDRKNAEPTITDDIFRIRGGVLLSPEIRKRLVLLRDAYKSGTVRFSNECAYHAGISALKKIL